MLDVNHLLFFIAVATSLAVLVKSLRTEQHLRAWRLAAVAVLLIAAGSWLVARKQAGYIAGGAWLTLLFVPAIGLRRVAELAERRRFRTARHLATVLRILHPSSELRHEIELLRMYEARPELSHFPDETQRRLVSSKPLRVTPAVLILILLNIAVFLIQLTRPNWQAPLTLHRLGALEPFAVIYQHQYWRVLTALFLHFDILHITFNLFALYVLGPALERAVGSLRFFLCYFFAGIGSSLGVVSLSMHHIARADQLVGASGCIMGIVGAWAAYLLRHRHMPLAKQRLLNVGMIIAIQTAFDISTPQISMAAHLCGLAAGFIVGLLLAGGKATWPG